MQIGVCIRQRREEIGWSLADLATKATISKQYLSDIERGARTPPEGTLDRLADALCVDRDYLQFVAGRLPSDVRKMDWSADAVDNALAALRKSLLTSLRTP